jgi:hypothetical protein
MGAASGQNGLRMLPPPVGIAARAARAAGVSAGIRGEVAMPARPARPGVAGTGEEPGSGAGHRHTDTGGTGTGGTGTGGTAGRE